uniref:RING-type E3 ubiquitin transferase n=1 Tax=Takifugu rubripes TaxID=31033 RepID=A0A674MW66_TAKRU
MVRAVLVTATSLALTGAVVAHAYLLKHQFYPTVVYLTKSSPSMAVLYIQAFVLVFILGKFMRKVFFGQLRAAEMEHLIERSWYAVTETCLAFTVFRDDFSPRFVALFTLLLFLKCFHWLAEDRVDFYAILLTMVLTTFIKYLLHTIDLNSENPWENKAVYMLYTELFTGFIKVLLYIAFMTIMIKVHTFPLFAIRPMYLAMRQFKKAVTDAIMSRRAIRNMNTLYPDATPEDLQASDNVCIICREEMVTGAKKLPCNHIFHSSCLRSWFQRQQTCPTCRMDVLRASNNNQTPAQPQAQPPLPAGPPNAPAAPPANVPGMLPGFPPGIFPFWGPFPAVPPPAAPPAAADAPQSSTEAPQASGEHLPFSSCSGGPLLEHGCLLNRWFIKVKVDFILSRPVSSMPPPPPSLSQLSEEELRDMEAEGRRGLEARLQCLQNIHTLLDAAMLNIHHYLSTVTTLAPPRADGGPDVSTSHIHSSPVVGSSTDVEDAPSCEYAKQVSQGRNAESRPAKDLLSSLAELPHAAEDAAVSLDTERQTADEGAAADEEGEPSAAELRRRRLRKLASSPFTPPPPEN